jgi:putative membrane protein
MWHPDSFGMAILSSVAFGFVGIVLTLLGFKLFDWITPGIKLEHELAEKQNIAVAIVTAAILIGISIVMASIVSA